MARKAVPTRTAQRPAAPTNLQQRALATRRETPTVYGKLPPAPPLPRTQPAARQRAGTRQKTPSLLVIGLIAAPLLLLAIAAMLTLIGAFFLFSGSTALPGVSAAGVALGGLTAPEAAARLQNDWTLHLSEGERLIPVNPAALGITLDADATAELAVTYGRRHGNLVTALIGSADLPPVINIDISATESGLAGLRESIEQPPVNAGIQLVQGMVQPRAALMGKALDLNATLAPLRQDASRELEDGILDLVMIPVAPAVSDATPLVNAAGALLVNPLQISLYDPIDNSGRMWTLLPETWSEWLVASGEELSFDPTRVRAFLAEQQAQFTAGDYLDVDESIAALQAAIARRNTQPRLRIYHHERQHVVQAGDSLIGIAWDYGIPYPWIQQANPGVETLSVGQTITIPSPDAMLPLPPVWEKRIVVSMSEQRVRVYEGGALKWDWVASTGIASSPTWRGVYQIISHEQNAYASNWDLWMPNFLGVYRPVPGADFVNGFHGFPTRGGSQLLWTNSLGTRVTYGCILLSNENAQALYSWAEEGVVVEITA